MHRHVLQHPESPHNPQIHSTVPRNILLMQRQKCTAHRLVSKAHSCTTVHRHGLKQRCASDTLTLHCKHQTYRENSKKAPRPVLQHKDTSCNAHLQPTTQTHVTNCELTTHHTELYKTQYTNTNTQLKLANKHRIISQSTDMPHNAQYQVTMRRHISCHDSSFSEETCSNMHLPPP